jgi:hypothetical protein
VWWQKKNIFIKCVGARSGNYAFFFASFVWPHNVFYETMAT